MYKDINWTTFFLAVVAIDLGVIAAVLSLVEMVK